MTSQEKEERKKYVKEQRKKFFSNPQGFLKEYALNPLIKYWKEEPLHAIGTLFFWLVAYYLIWGGIQAINNDMIYCNSSINKYDGKIMYTFNDFVEFYNEEAIRLQNNAKPLNPDDIETVVKGFNSKYSMFCDYDLERWWKEPLFVGNKTNSDVYCDNMTGCTTGRLETISYGFVKIIFKRS